MFTKAQIFNLALGALLLQRRVIDADSDTSNEGKVLQTHWPTAWASALQDMDLDGTSTQLTLELIAENPNDLWTYAYKYPVDCVFFRRIQSLAQTDNRRTHIAKRVGVHSGQKVIFTHASEAVGEYISINTPFTALNSSAGLAVAYRLAILSAPLITGKGAEKLRKDLEERYIVLKAEAQEQDRRESFVFNDEYVESEFVDTRLS